MTAVNTLDKTHVVITSLEVNFLDYIYLDIFGKKFSVEIREEMLFTVRQMGSKSVEHAESGKGFGRNLR